jgi:hypothetical protein
MSLLLSVRIWKGLLCHVRHWCAIDNQWIVRGIVMVFDVVATLGGVAIATFGGGSVSTLRDLGRGGASEEPIWDLGILICSADQINFLLSFIYLPIFLFNFFV